MLSARKHYRVSDAFHKFHEAVYKDPPRILDLWIIPLGLEDIPINLNKCDPIQDVLRLLYFLMNVQSVHIEMEDWVEVVKDDGKDDPSCTDHEGKEPVMEI